MRFKPSYKVNYDRNTKVRSVTIQGYNSIYIVRATPPGLSRPHYQVVNGTLRSKCSQYFPTVRDAIIYIIQGI